MAGKTGKKREDGGESEVDLLIRLLKLGSLINTPMKEGVCEPAGISATELKIVMALAGEGALAGHELSEIMGMAPMNVSRSLKALRERGWITDATDPANRRRRPVRLTREGMNGYRRMQGNIADVALALAGTLDDKQRAAFAEAADIVIGQMAEWIASRHDGFGLKG